MIAGVGGGSASPTASSGATLPPVAIADQVVADGRAVPRRTAELAADAPATVATVPAELGQQVAAGTTLVTMETDADRHRTRRSDEAAAEAATARSEQAAASVKQASEQVAVAEATLDQAQAALATARDRNVGEDEAAAARNTAPGTGPGGQGRSDRRAGRRQGSGRRRPPSGDRGRLAGGDEGWLHAHSTVCGNLASVGSGPAAGDPGQVLVRVADTTDWEFETTDLDESGIARIASAIRRR